MDPNDNSPLAATKRIIAISEDYSAHIMKKIDNAKDIGEISSILEFGDGAERATAIFDVVERVEKSAHFKC